MGLTTNSFNIRLNLHRNHNNNPDTALLPANVHLHYCANSFQSTILYISQQEDVMFLDSMEKFFIQLFKPELNPT